MSGSGDKGGLEEEGGTAFSQNISSLEPPSLIAVPNSFCPAYLSSVPSKHSSQHAVLSAHMFDCHSCCFSLSVPPDEAQESQGPCLFLLTLCP